jgi:aminopeptidase N
MIIQLMRTTAVALALAGGGLAGGGAAAQTPSTAPASSAQREILPVTAVPERQLISITPDAAARTFRGRTRIDVRVPRPTNRIVLNALDLTFDRAVVTGREGAPARVSADSARQQVTLTFGQPLAAGRHTLVIDYAGKISESTSGLFASQYTRDGQSKIMLSTQMEPGDARRLAPMWDEPAIKTVWEVEATVPSGMDVMSNMPAASTTPAPNGLKTVRFQPTPKMSSYLLFLGVGEYDRIQGRAGATELGIIAKRGDGAQGRYALESTAKILPFYNEYFGTAYPLPKLDQVAVPFAGGFGAMENWGAILYDESLLLIDPALTTEADRQSVFDVIAHEVAHQWFGNLVTMSWWDDLWLNEGFASWMNTKTTDHFNPTWKAWLGAAGGRDAAMALDARSTTHPVIQEVRNIDQANLAFDLITYQKGQAVIRMLESYIGEDAFRTGVRAYMKRHAYGNTVTEDLWREMDRAAPATPVTAIARDFTTQPGVPLITVEGVTCQGGRSTVSLRQGRFGVDAGSKQPTRWRVPVVIRTVGAEGDGRGVVAGGSGRVTAPGCGPVVVNAGQTGYFRTSYGEPAFARLRSEFTRLADTDQLGLLQDTWALGRGGYGAFARHLDLTRQVGPTADPIVQAEVVNSLTTLDNLYAAGPERERFRAYARGVLNPFFARLGWSARAGEAPNDSVLRASLIDALSVLDDPAVIAEARRRYAASAADPAATPADIRRAVVRSVGRHADAAGWADLQRRAAAASSPLEQRLYRGALALPRDPALAQRALDLAISDQTQAQYAPGLIEGVAGAHPDLAWRFYLANIERVNRGLDPLRRNEFGPGLASNGGTPARIPELRAFAERNIPQGSRRAVDQAESAIRYTAEMRARIRPEVDRWLQTQTSAAARR